MHGISPRDYSLTQRQFQTSAAVSQALPELPTILSDLVSQLAVTDFSLATHMLELDQDDEVIANTDNWQIMDCIELALTTSSTECEASIKSLIFSNATEAVLATGYSRYFLKPYLVRLINALQDNGLQINLDGLELDNLNLNFPKHINLSGVSARGAIFNNVNMDYLKMEAADFTGVKFSNITMSGADLSKVNFTDASLVDIWFRKTIASELVSNHSKIFQHKNIYTQRAILNPVPVQIETTCLTGRMIVARPDVESFKLPADKITLEDSDTA